MARSRQLLFAALIFGLAGLARAEVPAPRIPETPAGHALSAWLDAFNSGERASMESFIKTYAWGSSVDGTMEWVAETRGYNLLQIYASDPSTVFFRVRPRTIGAEELGRVSVSAAVPVAVTELGTWRIPPGAKVDVVELNARTRTRVVKGVAEAFERSYVYPEIARKMAAALRAHDARGDYRRLRYGIDLARRLSADLQEISHDKHAEVRFSFFVRPEEAPAKQAESEARRLTANNCGFEKAEHLRPNIGYLKFDMFADPAVCASTASAAMNFLTDSDALIIDLRDNHGGHGGMVELLASYLFDRRTHLEDVISRADNATTEAWTLPSVPGRKFLDKPVFVLTSHQTFSAAESLSYSLKNLQRATLIGETTLGGAHPTDSKPIDDHFTARIPFARSMSPYTKTNWEGTGVEPDVKVEAAQALDVALKLAAQSR
jgi:hypothetical protein